MSNPVKPLTLGEGCPPPLSCREVWSTLGREATPWKLDRGNYALRGWSCGTGPPLYFVNGFAGASALFCLTVWLLREEYRCVLYDVELPEAEASAFNLRTKSTVPAIKRRAAGPCSLADFTGDLLEAASFQGDHSFSVFSTNFGGVVALQAALVAPERVERLILQSVPAHGRLAWTERLLAHVCSRSPAPLRQLPGRLTIQSFNHRRWFPPLDPDRWQCFQEMTGLQPMALAARQALAFDGFDLRPQLAQLRQPVLLIDVEGAGTRLSEAQRELRVRLPNVQEERLHTTGLIPYLTHPHRLVKLIQAWGLAAKPQTSEVCGLTLPT